MGRFFKVQVKLKYLIDMSFNDKKRMANLFIECFQLFVVYGSLSSLGGHVDDDADVAAVLLETDVVAINVDGAELVDGRGLGGVRWVSRCLNGAAYIIRMILTEYCSRLHSEIQTFNCISAPDILNYRP